MAWWCWLFVQLTSRAPRRKEKKAEVIRKRKSVSQAADGAADRAAQQDTSAAAGQPATGQPAGPDAGGADTRSCSRLTEAAAAQEEELMEDVEVEEDAVDADEAGDVE